MSDENLKYFASLEPEKTANILMKRSQTFFNTLRSNDYLNKIRDMYRFYYGNFDGPDRDWETTLDFRLT